MVSKRRIYKSYRKCVTARRKLREKNKQLQRTVEQLVKDLMMANRIQAHPNPPYLKSDGSLNALGQLKLYEAGTSTAKIAYTDATGTSYGSTIDLDASALPENGPIFWDNDNLYKVEVYTRTDSVPTYALDYTVDNFGITGGSENTISTAVSWTVDGVGASSTTFATLTLAMVAARTKVILGNGTLTITVNDGTYTDETIDFTHPQGRYITISGESQAGTIFVNTSASTPVFNLNNDTLASINTMTLKHTGTNGYGLRLYNGAWLNNLTAVTLSGVGGSTPQIGLEVDNKSTVGSGATLSVSTFATSISASDRSHIALTAVVGTITSGSSIVATKRSSIIIPTVTVTAGTGTNILLAGTKSFISIATAFSGTNTSTGTAGVASTTGAHIDIAGTFVIVNFTHGITADKFGTVQIGDTTPTFTSIGTANYSPAADTIKSVTGGSADTALIIQDT